jgi:hypothetical protein
MISVQPDLLLKGYQIIKTNENPRSLYGLPQKTNPKNQGKKRKKKGKRKAQPPLECSRNFRSLSPPIMS